MSQSPLRHKWQCVWWCNCKICSLPEQWAQWTHSLSHTRWQPFL